MSEWDYLHGAAAQEHISNAIRAAETERLVVQYNRVIENKDNALIRMEQELIKWRAKAKRAEAFEESANKEIRKLKVQQKILQAANENLQKEIQYEARNVYDFVSSWINHYSHEVSQEFVEGVKEGMRMNLYFSNSESLRRRFIEGFEKQALVLYEDARTKEVFEKDAIVLGEDSLTKEAFEKISSQVAFELIREIQLNEARNNRKNPVPGLRGPQELREHYGEGNMKAKDIRSED